MQIHDTVNRQISKLKFSASYLKRPLPSENNLTFPATDRSSLREFCHHITAKKISDFRPKGQER